MTANAHFSVRKSNENQTQPISKVAVSNMSFFCRGFRKPICASATTTGEALLSHPCSRNLVMGDLTNEDVYGRETFA